MNTLNLSTTRGLRSLSSRSIPPSTPSVATYVRVCGGADRGFYFRRGARPKGVQTSRMLSWFRLVLFIGTSKDRKTAELLADGPQDHRWRGVTERASLGLRHHFNELRGWNPLGCATNVISSAADAVHSRRRVQYYYFQKTWGTGT